MGTTCNGIHGGRMRGGGGRGICHVIYFPLSVSREESVGGDGIDLAGGWAGTRKRS